ncbi:MAG TPA: DinB family protein [Trueperaceae bacterium]
MDTTTNPSKVNVEEQLTSLFLDRYRELLEGMPDSDPTWVTSGGREGGVYGTLGDLTAEEASRVVAGTTIAAHAEHLRWAIDMVNAYFAGKEPPSDWSESWLVKRVDETAWVALNQAIRRAGDTLLAALPVHHSWHEGFAVNGALASYGHAAYHLGALRQLKKVVRGAPL